jgi:hypothetical protein
MRAEASGQPSLPPLDGGDNGDQHVAIENKNLGYICAHLLSLTCNLAWLDTKSEQNGQGYPAWTSRDLTILLFPFDMHFVSPEILIDT